MPKNSVETMVFDSWAILALLQAEQPAADQVAALVRRAEAGVMTVYMSWINVGEVFYAFKRRKGAEAAERMLARLRELPIHLHEPREKDILKAARIKSERRVSYADAFAVGLALDLGGAVVTGDPELCALADMAPVVRLARGGAA